MDLAVLSNQARQVQDDSAESLFLTPDRSPGLHAGDASRARVTRNLRVIKAPTRLLGRAEGAPRGGQGWRGFAKSPDFCADSCEPHRDVVKLPA
jgi:hypothetical protein